MSPSHPPEKIWSAAELEAMTPAERHELFEASIISDLADAPPGLLARARATALEHIAQQQHQTSDAGDKDGDR